MLLSHAADIMDVLVLRPRHLHPRRKYIDSAISCRHIFLAGIHPLKFNMLTLNADECERDRSTDNSIAWAYDRRDHGFA